MTEIVRTKMGVITYLVLTCPLHDAAILKMLKKEVQSCLRDRDVQLVIDLIKVPGLTGECLETLLDIQDQLAQFGGSLKLVNANALVRDIFALTGFSNYVAIVDETKGFAP